MVFFIGLYSVITGARQSLIHVFYMQTFIKHYICTSYFTKLDRLGFKGFAKTFHGVKSQLVGTDSSF